MKIQCFHSSSAGNIYSISDGTTRIMIECGVDFKEIQKCFDFSLSSLAGCLITHEHGDHARSWEKVAKYTPVYMLKETAEALKATGYNIKHYTPHQTFDLGTFKVIPASAAHDVPCCYFVIYSTVTREQVLFATDTAYISKNALNTHYAMIECNYMFEHINAAVDSGKLPAVARNRVVSSHLELNETKRVLKAINPNTLQEIHILHLSNRYADASEVKKQIEAELGKPVYIAKE